MGEGIAEWSEKAATDQSAFHLLTRQTAVITLELSPLSRSEADTVKANIVRIGNSQGIRIPKVLLEQTQLSGEVELEVRHRAIVIRSVSRPRRGWAEQFRAMTAHGDDRLLDPDTTGRSSWDRDEWQWE